MRLGVRAMVAGLVALAAAPLVVGQPAATGGRPLVSQEGRPWPAPVATGLPEQPPVLSPADELKTFTMPPGWHVELVAAEPLVQDPILSEFDGDGRLWVMELPGWANGEKMDNSLQPVNRLVVLEDTDGNGVFDKRTVFMDKLILPRAFKILDKNCALVGEPPNLWKACDTNGDLVSDTKEKIADTFARQGVLEHGANGLFWGMDNTLYVSEHDWNVRYKDGRFSTEPTLTRGQWGVTQDDGGRIYRNVNTDPLFADYVSGRYYTRNPDVARTRGLYDTLVNQETSNIWPARPTLGINRGYRKETTRADGSSSYYQSVSSPMVYRGDRLPKELQGNVFVVDGATNLVHLLRRTDDGTGRLKAEDWFKRGEFLTSTDERFRPVALTPSWDGGFLITDMYRGVSQDGPIQTDYLRQYILKKKLWEGIHHGRIYRVVYKGQTADRRPAMSRDGNATLVGYLSHPNGWWRDRAQQLLVQRRDRATVPALTRLATGAPDWRTRLHALWTLDGMGAGDKAVVSRALADAQPDVRAAAVRLAEPFLADRAVRTAVLARMDDPSWFVRRQLAASLGELPAADKVRPMATLLARYGGDPITVDAAVSGLRDQEELVLADMLRQPGSNPDAVMALAAATAKGRDTAAAGRLLAFATDAGQPEAIRMAVLNGVAGGVRGTLTADTTQQVAGGRAGGGIGGRRGPAAKPLDLPAEPVALVALAKGKGPQAEAAADVAQLVTWPGRPVAAVAVVARTPQQETLFAAGKGIYDTLCTGCHMPNGQGAPNVAASLAGSRLVTGQPTLPVRVLLAGKEGSIGLMPPIGADMSDEDLAAITTFIRGSFGNTAAPVSPAETKEWRSLYAFRKVPWTDTELLAAAPPAAGGARTGAR